MDDPGQWPLGRLLSTAARLVEHEWNDILARYDLTHAGLLALHVLRGGPRTQRELAAACGVEEQTMRTTLDRLARLGYLTKQRDTADRRRLVILATDRGLEAYDQVNFHDLADRIVTDRVEDHERFQTELVRLTRRLLDERRSAQGPGQPT